ncbi:hypothetical protein [Rhizobium sp. AN69]|uniref:hypothetical protein n=1 Tax=Rhizobium sp. AN69 TaxID=3035213 RepID=UPI002B25C4B9|nr:hypothetical protein [Rhizobium sp. AN69]
MPVKMMFVGAAMKVSKEKLAANRAAIIGAAVNLFQERGIDGVGVSEISTVRVLRMGLFMPSSAQKAGS